MELNPPSRGSRSCRIDRIETLLVDIPFRRLQRFARLDARVQTALLVRIRDRDGAEGIGECIVPGGPWWSGDSVEAMKVTIDRYLAPAMIGRDPHDLDAIARDLDRIVRGAPFARSGLEMACLDLLGKRHGLPVCALLGGALRRSCRIAWPLASGSVATDIAEIEEMLASGRAGAFKVKMGADDIAQDLSRITDLVRALDGRAPLRVDPNESWNEALALRVLPRLAELGVELVEQPVPRGQIDVMARLSARAPVPIMIDEGAWSAPDMLRVAQAGAAHVVSVKIMKSGGLRPARRMADIAAAAGIGLYIGTFLETAIGSAAGLHLAAGFADLPLGGELFGPLLMAEEITTEPLRYADGALHLPEGPGLGVTLDEAALRALARA